MNILKHRANTETFNIDPELTQRRAIRTDKRNDIAVSEALEASLRDGDEYLMLEPIKLMDFNTLETSYVYTIYVNVAADNTAV